MLIKIKLDKEQQFVYLVVTEVQLDIFIPASSDHSNSFPIEINIEKKSPCTHETNNYFK